ncbi:MAG: diacylglycerol kinase family protein [Bacteroidaceae bacterium]|nr:diacylglycerol kinase family protein [Bacteroidaceae bacterium]
MNRQEGNKPRFSLQARLHSFVYAARGLKLLLREHNAWIHLVATICVLIVGIMVSLSPMEWAVVTILIGGVWVAEAFNTAIEYLCNHVTPEQHPHIAHIKDIAAAAVVLAAITAVVGGLCIFVPRIIECISI